jgi:hypothetical protein
MSVAIALEGFIHVPVRWSIRGRAQGTQGKVGIAETDFLEFEAMVEEQQPKSRSQSADGTVGADELKMYVAGRVEKNGRQLDLNDYLTVDGKDYVTTSARYRIEGDYTHATMKRTTRKAVS